MSGHWWRVSRLGSGDSDARLRAGTMDRAPDRAAMRSRLMAAAGKDRAVSKASCPLKLPASIKAASARLTCKDGMSLNQWTAATVAKVGTVETVAEFFRRREEGAKPGGLCAIPTRFPDRTLDPGGDLPEGRQP